MLCSVPAGKSTSNWLDRLRTTRGFPTSSGVDLDHFLTDPQNRDPSSSSPAPDPSTSEPARPSCCRTTSQSSVGDGQSGKEWYGIMTNVLSDLFNMGDPGPNSAKKSSRKQRNPRFCPNSSDFVQKEDAAIVATLFLNSDSNSLEKAENEDNVGLVDAEEEDDELVGYSRSEVTVIDTSCADWKFEKLLFRRKNVWKARDRRGKSRGGPGRKKRKATAADDTIFHGKKKHKFLNFDSGSLNEGLDTPNGTNEVCKSNSFAENPSQGPKMSFPGSSTMSPRNRRSSLGLIKEGLLPTGKKKLNLLKSSHVKL